MKHLNFLMFLLTVYVLRKFGQKNYLQPHISMIGDKLNPFLFLKFFYYNF